VIATATPLTCKIFIFVPTPIEDPSQKHYPVATFRRGRSAFIHF
jgi:hypothetical protein